MRKLPSGVYDGEIGCLDLNGRPCFESLENFSRAHDAFLFFYAFDLLNLNGKDVMRLPLIERKEILGEVIDASLGPIRISSAIDAKPEDLIGAIKAQKLEGVVAKKRSQSTSPANDQEHG